MNVKAVKAMQIQTDRGQYSTLLSMLVRRRSGCQRQIASDIGSSRQRFQSQNGSRRLADRLRRADGGDSSTPGPSALFPLAPQSRFQTLFHQHPNPQKPGGCAAANEGSGRMTERLASGQILARAQEILPGMPEFSIQHFGGKPERTAKAKAGQSHPKATSETGRAWGRTVQPTIFCFRGTPPCSTLAGEMQKETTLALLRQMLGPAAQFRDGQWEAIDLAANQRRRLLVVQRTGWGKSVVYFLAARILRDAGAGPTLLISPLLSLMRNQILAAERLGIRAATIHSQNLEDWEQVEAALQADQVDVLMVSPERLGNAAFLQKLLPLIKGSIGMFVVDEAHCISDWGHDFRPDYRRIVRILRLLPPGVPVLCTTATANDRVVKDIESQIANLHVVRGPLVRHSLKLFNIKLDDQADRLAWLGHFLPPLPGR